MTDPRERRRQRAASEKEKKDVAGALKKFRVPIVIVILWAAIVGFQVAQAQGVIGEFGEDCPGHWHAGYSVWIEDEQLSFNPQLNPAWADQGAQPAVGFHLHDGSGNMHMHPGERCIPFGSISEKLNVEVRDGRMVVEAPHGPQGTYEDNETHEVVVYHQPWGEDWRKVGNIDSFMGKQVGNGDRVMVAYLDPSAESLIESHQLDTFNPEGSNYEPPAEGGFDDGAFVGITMTSIFAILAIVLWYNFAKKTW